MLQIRTLATTWGRKGAYDITDAVVVTQISIWYGGPALHANGYLSGREIAGLVTIAVPDDPSVT